MHRETIVGALKAAPAWLAVGISHVVDNITLAGIASIAAIVYSVVQTYISIQRYRRNR